MICRPRILLPLALVAFGCGGSSAPAASADPAAAPPAPAPPAEQQIPPLDPTNIVSIAVGSKDHTTLVAALKAADYVTPVANPGPLTVFAPTNAAFAKLPPGTVEGLLKPEKVADLREVLKYHVTTSVYQASDLKDGQVMGMANGAKATIHIKDGKLSINDANVLASIRASNGILHVIDGVLLPPAPAAQ
jgi:uncharacterized surface protein with fasciclin (FAS1) repeats